MRGKGKGYWMKVVKRYKLLVVTEIGTKDVMCNMVNRINIVVWYIVKLLGE